MTSGRPEQSTEWIPAALTVAAIVAAGGFALAVWNLGSSIVSTWLAVFVQVLGAMVGLSLAAAVVLIVPVKAFDSVVRIAKTHREAAREVRKRTPALLAILVLGAQAVGIIADRAFDADPWVAVAVQFLALGLFWVANELAVRDSKTLNIVGRVLWFSVVVYLAWIWYLWRAPDLSRVWADVVRGGSRRPIIVAVALVLLLLLPFLVPSAEAKEKGAA